MRKIHIWYEGLTRQSSDCQILANLEYPNGSQKAIFYKFPEVYQDYITDSSDPFVLATLFLAMNRCESMHIHGKVSPSLLQNLTEYQAIWSCWCPQQYHPIEITADEEQEDPAGQALDERAICSFSGGVDSCFTAFRHATQNCGRWTRHLKAGLMVHGFDIPLGESITFDKASSRSKIMLDSLGVDLVTVSTNLRELPQNWEFSHGAAVASVMMLLRREFNVGLVASTDPYQQLPSIWGSHPIVDHLLSNSNLKIIHDGAAFSRTQKVQELSNWGECLENLRVCWQGAEKDRNCGKCEKCIRTILNFRVLGLGLPACFDDDVTDAEIQAVRLRSPSQCIEFDLLLQEAQKRNIKESWVDALTNCINRNKTKKLLRTLKDRVQRVLS